MSSQGEPADSAEYPEGHRPGNAGQTTPRIERALERVKAAYLKGVLLRGGGRTVALSCGMVVLFFGLDNLFAMASAVRFSLGVAFLCLSAFSVWRNLMRPLVRDIPPEACALLLEKECPELDCRLINSLLLSRRKVEGFGSKAVERTKREADFLVRRFRFPSLFEGKGVFRVVAAGGAALLAVVFYGLLFPSYFGNAFKRFVVPFGNVTHVDSGGLVVTPGDVTLCEGDTLVVRAVPEGPLPEKVYLGRGDNAFQMNFDGRGFTFEFPPLRSGGFTYRVFTQDSKSPLYRVSVARAPSVVDIKLRYEFPGYTGRLDRFEERSSGHVRALKGTRVTVSAAWDMALKSCTLEVYGEERELKVVEGNRVEGRFEIEQNGSYKFISKGRKHGLEGGKKREYTIEALRDKPPAVCFVRPEEDTVYRIGQPVKAVLKASDDWGVSAVLLCISESVEGPWRVAGSWRGEKGKTSLCEEVLLYPKKERLALKGIAKDFLGQKTGTGPLCLRALSPKRWRERELSRLGNAVHSLRRILELQKGLLERTRSVYQGRRFDKRLVLSLKEGQAAIIKDSRKLLVSWEATPFSGDKRLRFSLLVQEEMGEVVSLFGQAALTREPAPLLAGAMEVESRIISVLKALINGLQEAAASVKKFRPEALKEFAERFSGKRKALEELRGKLQEFIEDQKGIKESSERLAGKQVEDFTREELQSLEKLAKKEENWAGVFKAEAEKYSKLGPQDFGDTTLARELVEAYREVDLASDALNAKKMEIAVSREEVGLELAEELKWNLERWLAKEPDHIKWSMEDPLCEIEAPMPELPGELEDIVGELIDGQEAMSEDVQDVTSAWMDSLDKGAGGPVSDGPISNMSAKGITGNLQPNQNEIGGRSGEGRSGRSHGQMVEKTATGKGGRPTPTRVTPDPFEDGQVRDTGRDPASGSTGGGKLAGSGPQGLRGPDAPDLRRKLRGLNRMQSRVRSRAERMERRLERLNLNAGNLRRALSLMRAMEELLAQGQGGNVARLHAKVVRNLRKQEADLTSRSPSQVELGELPKGNTEGMVDAQAEEIPESYGEVVKEYFDSLSSAE